MQYDAVLTQKIQDQLVVDHEIISLGSRTQFIDDYFTLAFAGIFIIKGIFMTECKIITKLKLLARS